MDSKEIYNKVNQISSKVNDELSDFYNSLKDDVTKIKAKAKSGTDRSRVVRECPILEQIEPINEEQRQTVISTVRNIRDFIKENPNDFQGVDVSERGDDLGSKESGREYGIESKIINVGIPKWVQELENSVKAKLERVKKREYFDVEGLIRGVTRKKKEKGMKRIDYVYFLLDVSGSMEGYSYRGINLKKLLASYVPAIAKKFKGMWLQVDGCNIIGKDLQDIGKGEIKSLILYGGGGADFYCANEFMREHIQKNNITNPIIVLASDAHEDFRFELLPNTIFLTTSEGWQHSKRFDNGLISQGFPNPLKGQKVILIEID